MLIDMMEDEYSPQAVRLERLYRQQKLARYLAAVDCRDPDHPGCHLCMTVEETQPSTNGWVEGRTFRNPAPIRSK